ncbi:MAG: hypothetical protein AAFS10_09900 [Myxococcota bacterium]
MHNSPSTTTTPIAPAPLRVMIYDATCRTASFKLRGHKRHLPIGLSHSWRAGAVLYRGWGRLDHTAGFSDWATALTWLANVEPERPLGSIQFWGHGRWGHILIDKEPLSRTALSPNHVLHGHLKAIQERLCGPEALWWFRTCETFGAEPGHHFARTWTDFMACQAAGHTFVIGPWQSGLHSLKPGATPHWSPSEGLQAGRPDAPLKAFMSGPRYPHTIHCLQGQVPPGW